MLYKFIILNILLVITIIFILIITIIPVITVIIAHIYKLKSDFSKMLITLIVKTKHVIIFQLNFIINAD